MCCIRYKRYCFGIFKTNSIPSEVLSKVYDGFLTPIISAGIIEEYIEVLHRNKFNFSHKVIDEFIDFLNNYALKIDSDDKLDINVLDPEDVVFYQVTMKARKKENTYLVTGNLKHFPKKTYIVTPRQMLDIIENNT